MLYQRGDNRPDDPIGDRVLALVKNLNLLIDKLDVTEYGAMSLADRQDFEDILAKLPNRFSPIRDTLRSSNVFGMENAMRVYAVLARVLADFWIGTAPILVAADNGGAAVRYRSNLSRAATVLAGDFVAGVSAGARALQEFGTELELVYPIPKTVSTARWTTTELLKFRALLTRLTPKSRLLDPVFVGPVVNVVAANHRRMSQFRVIANATIDCGHLDPAIQYSRYNATTGAVFSRVGAAGNGLDQGAAIDGGTPAVGGQSILLSLDPVDEGWPVPHASTAWLWKSGLEPVLAQLDDAIAVFEATVAPLPTIGAIRDGAGIGLGGLNAALTIRRIFLHPVLLLTLVNTNPDWLDHLANVIKLPIMSWSFESVAA
jgi:hypothetical protein